MAFDPVHELAEATARAAERWSAATGCDVRVEAGGLPVRWATTEELTQEDGALARGVTHRGESGVVEFIGYRKGPVLRWTAEAVMAHEIAHALGCWDHTTDGSIQSEGHALDAKISEAGLACVCSALHCETMTAELM
jgi:hypothetical protein